ncbi:hypothetical protein DGG96_18025 [Legionella qingyii]|uniref:Uncharacterized protein n=1 Tax=Legionella qingyii TaxID=2184757 RepID=A0A317TXK5_9GAMM|nr:hypothetical protein DGG96_18025 [Legionella qingyii]RUR20150.1 hypothetical protein ELY20_15035 [Legionella qingyii]RUR22412.1 hypothetical protein ELY16_14740 [Legionella qingyii]
MLTHSITFETLRLRRGASSIRCSNMWYNC